MREEIIIGIVMLVVSAAGSIWKKNDKKWAVLFMFLACIAGSLVAGMGIRFREIVEGPFALLDSALSVCCASVFAWLLYAAGSFDYIFSGISKIKNDTVRAFAVLLFIAIPAALTGFASASVLTTGKIVAENLKTKQVEKKKITAVVAGGAVIGLIMPPNCVPAMIAANAAGTVLPTPYVGFFLPLLITAVPSYILFALLNKKTLASACTEEINEKKVVHTVVFAVLIVVLLLGDILSSYIYLGGNVLSFAIASVILIALEKGFGSIKKCIDVVTEGVEKSVWPIALMFVVGSFVEVSSMSGVRGLYGLWILPLQNAGKVWLVMFILMAISLVVGYFLNTPIPAFLITYAVYPISWLANVVVVTGCATALMIIPVICKRNGLIEQTGNMLGIETKYKDVIGTLAPLAAVTLVCGVVWVYFGDKLPMLIL